MKRLESFGTIIMFMTISLLSIGILVQECQADEDDEEQIEEIIDNFHLAWRNRDMNLMDEIWSYEDDVRVVFYTEAVPENNFDYRSWAFVRPFIHWAFSMSDRAARLDDISIELGEGYASAKFSSSILEPYSKEGFALLRKENDNWKIYLYDFTGLLAIQNGDDSGNFVEIAFEAEDGKGAAAFIFDDPDASQGKYILNMGQTSFEFSVPEEGEYTVWGRTHAPNSDDNSFSVTIDNLSDRWDVGCSPTWTWNQMNFSANMGPKILKLEDGAHALSLQMREDGTRIDAIYITNKLSLRADQIQRRFELTMGYIEEPDVISSLDTQKSMIATWGRLKR